MEPDQVHVIAAAVSGGSQQILHAVESRFARQIVRDVGQGNPRNRIHDDMTVVHRVTAADLDMGVLPDANAASDSADADARAKTFREQHIQPATRQRCRRS